MSAEDDDIDWIKRELKRLGEGAQTSNSGVPLIEQLAAAYEDRIAREQMRERAQDFAFPRSFGKHFRRSQKREPTSQLEAAYVDALEARGEISKQQKTVITRHRTVRFGDNGSAQIVWPSRDAYRRGVAAMLLLLALAVVALGLVWEVFWTSYVGIAISWTMGSLLGWMARRAYDSAWGWERVANLLHARHRWFAPSRE